MYVVTWQESGRKLWEAAKSRALAIEMSTRRHGTWAYVAI